MFYFHCGVSFSLFSLWENKSIKLVNTCVRDCSDSFVVIFSVFILSMPSKVIIIVIEFMFLGINMFWALLRAHFNPRLTARAKMSLSRAQNIFMLANINSIVLL